VNERSRLPWTEEEVAKLRSLTGNHSTAEIAQELGRGVAATITKAADLHISLGKKRTLKRDGVRLNQFGIPKSVCF
jgi:hypothetical protein